MEKIRLKVSADDDEVAYVKLPDHPESGAQVSKTIRLYDCIGKYKGPDLYFDFDESGTLIGIEILA